MNNASPVTLPPHIPVLDTLVWAAICEEVERKRVAAGLQRRWS